MCDQTSGGIARLNAPPLAGPGLYQPAPGPGVLPRAESLPLSESETGRVHPRPGPILRHGRQPRGQPRQPHVWAGWNRTDPQNGSTGSSKDDLPAPGTPNLPKPPPNAGWRPTISG